MITATYTATNYKPEEVSKRYVRFDGEVFRFCEVGNDRRFDIRQGIVSRDELPDAIATAASERRGFSPSYVEWPI